MTHSLHDSVLKRYNKLQDEVDHLYDVFFAYDASITSSQEARFDRYNLDGDRLIPFRNTQIFDFDFSNPVEASGQSDQHSIVPGNLDLLYIYFTYLKPDYVYYWFIEYDVAFSGPWSEFFSTFQQSNADIIGSTIRPFKLDPNWYWWPSLETPPEVEKSEWIRGFFPIVRLSRDILQRLEVGYRDGWAGHSEAILPTLAQYHGMEIEDFGGDGSFVRKCNRNQFYTNTPWRSSLSPGTFVYRPARPRKGISSGKLWHPVKPGQGITSYIRMLKHRVAARIQKASSGTGEGRCP